MPGYNSALTALTIDAQDRIVATGSVIVPQAGVDSSLFGQTTEIAVVRYNNDGSLDLTFNAIRPITRRTWNGDYIHGEF